MNNGYNGWELKILAIIALTAALVYSQAILFPLLFSFFLYLLLDPIVEWLVSIKCPRILASSLVLIILMVLVVSTMTFLLKPATIWLDKGPENFQTLEQKFTGIKKSLGEINKVADKAKSLTQMGDKNDKNKVQVIADNSSFDFGFSIFGMTTNVLLLIGTILLLVFFFLNYFKIFIENLERILTKRNIIKESNWIDALQNNVSDYLFIFTLVCAGLGIVVGTIFWLIGMPDPIFFGFMAALLTFIPYLGNFIGLCVTLFISLLTFDSYLSIIGPPLIYFLLAFLEGQIVTPILLGNRLNLNPLIVFLNMLIWSALWGISGLIISIPMLITIKITLENLPAFAKLSLLMEDAPEPGLGSD